MAQNYTLAEAVEIAAKKENVEAMNDLGRRYPLLMAKIYAVVALAGDAAVDLLSYIPERVSANKVNVQIKNALLAGESDDSDDDSEEAEEKPAAKSKKERAAERRAARKAKKAAEEAEENEEDSEEEDDSEAGPYDGKNAMELFKMCKERGIAAKPKRSAKFYIDLLTKADEEAEDAEEDSEDDWEEEEEEKPAKKAKATPKKEAEAKKPAKAKAAKKEADEDDDEDWDI